MQKLENHTSLEKPVRSIRQRFQPQAGWSFTSAIMTGVLVAFLPITLLPSSMSAAERRTVCAQTLYVRDSQMRVIGTLFQGQSFDVYRGADNGTVYGFAYGQINHNGYVWPQYLCP